MRRLMIGVIGLVLVSASVAMAGGNIVNDGSFEDQPASLNNWCGYGLAYDNGTGNASATFGGWRVAGITSIDLVNRWWQAAEGYQSVDMNGNMPGSIYQDLLTQPGQQYALSFSLAGSPGHGLKHLEVSWNGNELASIQFDATYTTRDNMGWETKTYYVTATGPSTRLEFTSLDQSSGAGAVLDNVGVVAVPEPSTICLVFSIFGIAIGWRRLRKP